MPRKKTVSREKGHYFDGSQPCSLCKCGKKTAKAKKNCPMHKYVVEIVYYLKWEDFWERDEDYRKEHGEPIEDIVVVKSFGVSVREAELAAMKLFEKDNYVYRAYPFVVEKIPRREWLPRWIAKQEQCI